MKKNKTTALTVDEYLEVLPDDVRDALQRIRGIIESVVPDSKERIAYQIPIVSINRDLVGFSAQKNYCSFYTMSPPLIKKMENDLRKFEVSGATIHFQPDEPLPERLVKKILHERIKEVQKK